MEEMAESIGKLSMNAKEWRPQQQQQQHQQQARTSSLSSLATRPLSSSSMLSPLPPPLDQQQRHYSAGGIWQHRQQQQQQSPSDLTAVAVSEFIPGRGWSPGSGAGVSGSNSRNNNQNANTSSQTDLPWRGGGSGSGSISGVSADQAGESSFGQSDLYSGARQSSLSYSPYKHQHPQTLPLQQRISQQIEPEIGSGGGGAYPIDDGNDLVGVPMMTTVPAGPVPPPPFRSLHTMGIPDDLWRYYRDLALEAHRQMDPSDPRHKAVPPPFCNAFCLDPPTAGQNSSTRSSFGYPSTTFQVTSAEDGYLYCVRRFDNVRCVSSKIAAAVTERWTTTLTSHSTGSSTSSTATAATSNHQTVSPTATGMGVGSGLLVVQHPGVVRFRRCFCAQRAVFFVHDYIPGARTLRERSLGNTNAASVSEPFLWSAVSQLVSALRAIHTAKLAVRCLTAQHILFNMTPEHDTGGGLGTNKLVGGGVGRSWRLRINCLGVVDALEFEARKNVVDLQREDIRDLGRLILTLATGTEITRTSDSDTIHACEMYLAQQYSRDLHSLAMTLIRSAHPPTILDVSRAMAGRIFDELDRVHVNYDRCEQALASEYESGRALRLLLKLGFINERPEFGMNRRWAQSGDCYVLTLFRDYVFHQADGAGNPVMDLGHVISALNKLDAADEEKIVLASRDGKSLLVVSYADVARCLDNAFLELCGGAVPPLSLQY